MLEVKSPKGKQPLRVPLLKETPVQYACNNYARSFMQTNMGFYIKNPLNRIFKTVTQKLLESK